MHPPVSGWRSRVESPLIHLLWIFIVALFPSGESYPQDSSDIHRVRMKEDSLFASGMMAFGEGRLQSALAAFFTISDTVRPGIHANIAAVQAAMGDVKSAEKEWRRALVLDTSSFRVRLQLADLLDRQGRTEEAEGFYRRALKQDSTFPAALEGLGNLLVRKRAYSEALPILSRAIAASPRNAGLYAQMGTALSKSGKADSARTMLATSLALSPSNVTVMVQLGSLYLDKKAYEDAFRLFRVAAQAQPWNSDILFKAGLCREKTEDLDVATDYYRKAALADTANVLAFGHLGSVYFQRKMYDSSVIAYRAAAALEPENPGVFINMGISYSCIDSIAAAIACLRRAIAVMNPEDIGSAYERIGALQLGGNHVAAARESYRRAALFDPSRATALFYQGFCCDQLRQYDQARKLYTAFLHFPNKRKSDAERVAVARKRLTLMGEK